MFLVLVHYSLYTAVIAPVCINLRNKACRMSWISPDIYGQVNEEQTGAGGIASSGKLAISRAISATGEKSLSATGTGTADAFTGMGYAFATGISSTGFGSAYISTPFLKTSLGCMQGAESKEAFGCSIFFLWLFNHCTAQT